MKFIELNKALKENVEHLYSLVGDDQFLLAQAVTLIKNATIKQFEELNFVKIDNAKLSKSEFVAQLETLPMGNDYRLIVLENAPTEICNLLNKYEFSDGQVVVVKNGKLSAGVQVDCAKLDRVDISKYILNYFTKRGLKIEERALDYIIDATGGNMASIVNELNKLASYAGEDEGTISIDIATNLVANSIEYVSFMLTNAIDNKSYKEYQNIINIMTKTQTAGDIFASLGRYFRRMQYIAINKDDNKLSSILGIKTYAIKMSRQNIAKNGTKFYINLYQKYVELDYQIKSGKISADNALYQLVF